MVESIFKNYQPQPASIPFQSGIAQTPEPLVIDALEAEYNSLTPSSGYSADSYDFRSDTVPSNSGFTTPQSLTQSRPGQGQPLQGQQASVMPSRFPLTQAFGNYNPRLYRGITKDMRNRGADFAMKPGTPLAVPRGQWQVVEAFGAAKPGQRGKINGGWGNSVLVRNAQTGEMLRFSHLNKVGVKPGQMLQGGALIGLSGDTGNVTGAHLDLEYIDSRGRLADVLRSPYANNLFGS